MYKILIETFRFDKKTAEHFSVFRSFLGTAQSSK